MGAVAAMLAGQFPFASANQDPREKQAPSAVALRDAAKLVYEGHSARMKLGPGTRRDCRDDLEFLCQWSRRWLEAERAIDKA